MPADVGAALVELLPRLRRYALVLTRSPDLADELVQAGCERALSAAAGPEIGVPVHAWMFRILRNLWIDRGRRTVTRGEELDLDERHDLAGGDVAVETERRLFLDQVLRVIGRLPAEQRDVLLMVCVEERSYREAADVLGVPIGTVMSRLSRARDRLVELTGGSA